MNGYNYEFIPFSEIYNNIKVFLEYDITDIAFLVLGLVLVILLIFYAFPFIYIYLKQKKLEDIKIRNKKTLKSFALQKDIEDAIAEELKLS